LAGEADGGFSNSFLFSVAPIGESFELTKLSLPCKNTKPIWNGCACYLMGKVVAVYE
jgi:hypothetical protein